ncbi:MAG: RidA family protein [Chloroflexi bacterium]|nr:RidA family protein [Chloroflexota bacterium]
MERKIIVSEKAPKAIGPYSVGVIAGNFVFTAGQIGIDRNTGEIVEGGIQTQTRQALTNVKYILEEAGSGMDQVIKTTVFLKDMNDFAKMNEVYGSFFQVNPPARSAVQIAKLPKDAIVEIEVVAVL